MAASKETLELIHAALANAFADILTNGVKVKDDEGKVIAITAPASYMSVIRQFLNDNDIQALPVPGSPTANLVNRLPFAGTEDGDVRH